MVNFCAKSLHFVAIFADITSLQKSKNQQLWRESTKVSCGVVEPIAEKLLGLPAFDSSFESGLHNQIGDMTFIYDGDLPDGEAYEGDLISIEEINYWSVVGLSDTRITIILDAKLRVKVEVQYEDRDGAF